MSGESTEPKVEETKPEEGRPVTSSAVFSMFGGGAKKEKQEDEDRGENSGSAKAQREAAAAAAKENDEDEAPESEDVHFEPVVRLTEKVETKTHEESEDQLFKMRAKLFWFYEYPKSKQEEGGDKPSAKGEWKERGTGDVRLLKHKESGKIRLVMRREKTLKVAANHYIVPQSTLSPHVTSDRSWVWRAFLDQGDTGDYQPPEDETEEDKAKRESPLLAIRFGNADNANQFKEAFLSAQKENAAIFKKQEEQTEAQEGQGEGK